MILSGQSIRRRGLVTPFRERTVEAGLTYGLSAAGYDVRIAETVALDGVAHRGLTASPFALASTMERFDMPDDVLGIVQDKSTWARRGSTWARRGIAVRNIPIEPGWRGFLTLELINHGRELVVIEAGTPIAQVVFHLLDEPAEQPYAGRYQDQKAGPQPAVLIE